MRIERIQPLRGEHQGERDEVQELLKHLRKLLEEKAGKANRDLPWGTEGGLLDPEYRINVTNSEDLQRVRRREAEFGEGSPIGELFEVAKALIGERIFPNAYLFRASKYDDYINGVDELVIHKQSGEVLAIIDATTESGLSHKIGDRKGREKVYTKILLGVEIKYGIVVGEDGKLRSASSLQDIPFLILSVDQKTIKELATGISQNKEGRIEDVARRLRERIGETLKSTIENLIEFKKPLIKGGHISKERWEEIFRRYRTLLERLFGVSA